MGVGVGENAALPAIGDSLEEIARDVRTVSRIEAVPMLLRIVGETTGMGFAAVARVTEGTWTACAVYDKINFNLVPGGQLDISTTLCKEVREMRTPVVIDHASQDPVYFNHHTPKLYSIESYVSVPIVLSDGQYFGNLCAIDPHPAKVTQSGVLAMFTSFAQLIGLQLEAERNREHEQAALLDERATGELREQFIAVLSHDLRNPLAAVMAGGQLLKRKNADPAAVLNIAQRIDDSARRMSRLIDDTLDLARARLGGGIGIKARLVDDPNKLLQSVVHELQDASPDRVIATDIDVRQSVFCDAGRLQQVVSNLLRNALSHGSKDSKVSLRARIDASDLVVDVGNEGNPIPPEHMAHLFSPFWRRSTSSSREGLGLGLYICAQIVQAHGGTLGVTSSAESLTTFTVRLPLAATPRHAE
jgi:signal transduction histidine kinase